MQQSSLQAGWAEAKAPDGKVYYFHAESGETSWDRPAAMARIGTKTKGPTGANLFVVRKMRRGEFDEFTDRDLRAEFEKFGPLLRCEITLDRETGQSRGFGFVSFTCVEHADAAIAALHRQVVMGRTMNIEKTSDERDRVDKYAPLHTANTVTYS